jgi:hypothetical protein
VEKRLYLRVGDRVLHSSNGAWGEGKVVEVMTSVVPGGTSLVRILFQDGRQRTFGNDLDNESCCYFFGIRRVLGPVPGPAGTPPPARQRPARRLPNRMS